jgi:hypothetical protein
MQGAKKKGAPMKKEATPHTQGAEKKTSDKKESTPHMQGADLCDVHKIA